MIDPKDFVVGANATASDIDVDSEEFTYRGKRLTEERARKVADKALADARRRNLIPGRKSLSGHGAHSPRVEARLPEELHEELRRRAEAEGVSVSKLLRRAIERYLAA